MSTSDPTHQPAGAPEAHFPQGNPAEQQAAPYGAAAHPVSGGPEPRKLTLFLKISIILLAALTIASISLLFIGDFDGKFVRIFSTFLLFTVFVLLTAFDTSREHASDWYAPVALIANAYILGLLLIVIWVTPYQPYELGFEIFWKSIVVIGVTRAVLGCCQLLLRAGDGLPPVQGTFALVTSVLAVLSGILFTAPIAIETFDVEVPELYWKIAVAVLILTALGLAITLLLRWYYRGPQREAARAARVAAQAAGGSYYPTEPAPQAQQPAPVQGSPVQPYSAPPQAAAEEAPLLPWPTFPDGRPLPARADGQPDFSVPGAPTPPSV